MKVLVTGGQGVIGRALIENLLSKKYSVTSIDRTPNLLLQHKGCNYIRLDVLNIDELNGAEYDICYHLAAVNLDKIVSFVKPQETFDVNLQGTERVASWCIKNKVRMVYAGSSSTFFNRDQSPYTFSKAAAEDLLRNYQNFFNLDLNIATIYNVYGTCNITNKESSKLLRVWNTLLESKKVTIYGTGEQYKDFIHVTDVASALELLISEPDSEENWHIGSDSSYSINDIYKLYQEEVPGLELERKDAPNVDNSLHSLVNRNFATKFKWEPKISLPNYIKRSLQYANS